MAMDFSQHFNVWTAKDVRERPVSLMARHTNENGFSCTEHFPSLPIEQSSCGFQKCDTENWKTQVSGLSPKKAACKPFLVIKQERPCSLTVMWSCLLLFQLYFLPHAWYFAYVWESFVGRKRKGANGSASDSCLTCLASQWDGFHCRCNKAILAVGVLGSVQYL